MGGNPSLSVGKTLSISNSVLIQCTCLETRSSGQMPCTKCMTRRLWSGQMAPNIYWILSSNWRLTIWTKKNWRRWKTWKCITSGSAKFTTSSSNSVRHSYFVDWIWSVLFVRQNPISREVRQELDESGQQRDNECVREERLLCTRSFFPRAWPQVFCHIWRQI